MQSKNTKLIIFDWDGTLINSSPIVIEAHHQTAQYFAMGALDIEQLESLLGQPSHIVCQALTNNTITEASDYQTKFREYYHAMADDIPLFPHTVSLLDSLNTQGISCAIATNKPKSTAARELERTGVLKYFVQCEYADSSQAKPDPTMLKMILQQQNMSPEQALMIGDQTNDIDAAMAIGVSCWLVYDQQRPDWHNRYPNVTCMKHPQLHGEMIEATILSKESKITDIID